MRRIRHRLLVAVSALLLSGPTAVAFAGTPEDTQVAQADLKDAFFQSKYGYCDAEVISIAWGVSIDNAKSTIGNKLTNGQADVLDDVSSDARITAMEKKSTCYY